MPLTILNTQSRSRQALAALAAVGALCVAALIALAAIDVAPALAQASGSGGGGGLSGGGQKAVKIGENAGGILNGWVGAILLPLAAAFALGAFVQRQFAAILGILAGVCLVGGLVFAPDQVTSVIKDTWSGL